MPHPRLHSQGLVFDIPMQKEKTLLESCEGDVKVIEDLPNLVAGKQFAPRSENTGFSRGYGGQRRSSDLGSGRFSGRSLSQFSEETGETNFDRNFGKRRTEYGDRKFGERNSDRQRNDRPGSISRWRNSWS